MYVGEGEAALRDVFHKARMAAPSIVLLDEVDAVAGKIRSNQQSPDPVRLKTGNRRCKSQLLFILHTCYTSLFTLKTWEYKKIEDVQSRPLHCAVKRSGWDGR